MNSATAEALAVLLITDGAGDAARIVEIVRQAVAGGIRAVQVREPELSAREIAELCDPLRALLRSVGGVLIVNDRADVVAAGLADGVHLGHRSITPDRARQFLPPGALVGASAHDAAEIRRAAEQGADFVTLSPVFPTGCKPGGAPLGVTRAAALAADSSVPVVWLGGITPSRLPELQPHAPFGVAVMSAVCAADSPSAVARALVEPMREIEAP